MSFNNLVDKTLLKRYLTASAETYHHARDLAHILIAITALLACTLVFMKEVAPLQWNVVVVIVLCFVSLGIVRLGNLHGATITAVVGLAGVGSLIVFQRESFAIYEVYLLTSIYLFTILITTLVTYRPLYTYISMGMGTGFIIIHYVMRALPSSLPGHSAYVDDPIVCIGLISIAGMIASRVVSRRTALTQAMEAESAENRQRAVALEQSRTVLNAVIEQSPIPMIIAAPDETIVIRNHALLEYVGEEDSEGLNPGTKLSDTGVTWRVYDVDGNSIPLEEMPLRASLEGVATPGRELRFVLQDGSTKWAIQHATPIYDGQEHLIAGFSAFADITERKAAEVAFRESEEKYRNLIQHSHDAIYLLYDRKFEIVNRKFEQMFGVALTDVNSPGFDFMDLVAPRSRELIDERAKRLDQGEQIEPSYAFTALTTDGREVDVEATVSYIPYKDGVATQAFCVTSLNGDGWRLS